jgi:hypothetical protein
VTEGQCLALRQLRSVEASRPGGLEIISILEPRANGPDLGVELSLDCTGVPHRDGGLRLRGRERLLLLIPPRFPLHKPSVWTPHTRWAGTPHVQWGDYICLYAAPNSEWDPADGMFGLLERLWEWLRAASIDQLDPDGVPLHPPVAYRTPGTPLVIPRINTPTVRGEPWIGWAATVAVGSGRIDLHDWRAMREHGRIADPPADPAAAVLLDSALDWEYPEHAAGLILALTERGVDWGEFWRLLEVTALACGDQPLLLVVGTAMRGTRGGEARQHLSVWRIPAQASGDLWRSLIRYSDRSEVVTTGEQARERVLDWARTAGTEWCRVREARTEVTARRDHDSPISWFAGKTVAIWGCGAIGSLLAEWVTRAGATLLILRDSGGAAPGVLVRQNFIDADIGFYKAEMLAKRITAIDPTIGVQAHNGDVLDGPLDDGPWHEHADLVIDATASLIVATALERARATEPAVPVAGLLFGHTAEHGLAVLTPAGVSGATHDALRAGKLACLFDQSLSRFAQEFWPDPPRGELFQPEPGCSDPTFTGSAVETAALSAVLIRAIARDLQVGSDQMSVHLHALASAGDEQPLHRRLFVKAPWELELPEGLALRLSHQALEGMRTEVGASAKQRGGASETGGLLFGERDDAAGVMWVSQATGPPSDSEHSPEQFLCGVRGVRAMVAARERRARGSLALIGTWHTHPVSAPRPSARDLLGMGQILAETDSPLAQALLVIVGHSAGARPSLGGYLFEREQIGSRDVLVRGATRRLARSVWPVLEGEPRRATVRRRSRGSRA